MQDQLRPNILVIPAEGPLIATEREVTDLLGDAMSADADLVALPVSRLPAAFFDLTTGLAGVMAQKFVNYRRQLAVVGDITAHIEASNALRDFVRESNRGPHLWFVETMDALEEKLAAGR